MILVHRDKEVTFYNDKTKRYYTSRQGLSKPTFWNYTELYESGLQSPIGYDTLAWWEDE